MSVVMPTFKYCISINKVFITVCYIVMYTFSINMK